MRVTVYISERRDKDIIEILSPIAEGDRSEIIRGLVRDGLLFRSGAKVERPSATMSKEIPRPNLPIKKISVDLDVKLDKF